MKNLIKFSTLTEFIKAFSIVAFCLIILSLGLFSCEKESVSPKSAVSANVADTLGKYKVWNLYRTDGAINPACSTTPASQTIPYTPNIQVGNIIKASNGMCYTVAIAGFQMSKPSYDFVESYTSCKECIEHNL